MTRPPLESRPPASVFGQHDFAILIGICYECPCKCVMNEAVTKASADPRADLVCREHSVKWPSFLVNMAEFAEATG